MKTAYFFIPGNSSDYFQKGVAHTWINIVKQVSPNFLKRHSESLLTSTSYNNLVYVIDVRSTLTDPDSSIQDTHSWTLLKDMNDFVILDQYINRKNIHKLPILNSISEKNISKNESKKTSKMISQDTIYPSSGDETGLLIHYLNQASKVREIRQSSAFRTFINHNVRPSKWNLNIYGHFHIKKVHEVGFFEGCMPCFGRMPHHDKSLYLTLTSEQILISEGNLFDQDVQQVMTYSTRMKIGYRMNFNHKATNVMGIQLYYRKLLLQFPSFDELMKFSTILHLALHRTPYLKSIPFFSFAPERANNDCQILPHGQKYFASLCDQLRKATKTVCIAGWMIGPHFLLKRPGTIEDSPDRLDRVLQQIAQNGIKVFILVYKEPSIVTNNNSEYVESHLQKMSINITVLRHPSPIIPKLWSHHEKMVLIDERVVFVGGIDISYSRWDNEHHSIADVPLFFDGIDYNNNKIKTIQDTADYKNEVINRFNDPRMGWHDTAVRIEGPTVVDFKRHFVQYWYFVMHELQGTAEEFVDNYKKRAEKLVHRKKNKKNKKSQEPKKPEMRKSVSVQEEDNGFNSDEQFEKGEYILHDTDEQEIEELEYYEKWTHTNKLDSLRMFNLKRVARHSVLQRMKTRPTEIIVEGNNVNRKCGDTKIQVLRSASAWTIGMRQNREHSIHSAYIKMIKDSKKFIYIENQFFMGEEHQIFQHLIDRIIRAHTNRQEFKVAVLLPLTPDEPTDLRDQNRSAIQSKLLWEQYKTILRSNDSIISQLNKAGIINTEQYLYFFSLRNHGLFGKNKDIPKTELIYVHSKVMVVDDQTIILGSANINDRSMNGNRDSELGVIIESQNNKSEMIRNYRRDIWKQLFGIVDSIDMSRCWNKMIKQAEENTKIYRTVFGCHPDDTIRTREQIDQLQKKARPEEYHNLKDHIRGFAVRFPYHFLEDEDMDLKPYQKEFILLPNAIWN